MKTKPQILIVFEFAVEHESSSVCSKIFSLLTYLTSCEGQDAGWCTPGRGDNTRLQKPWRRAASKPWRLFIISTNNHMSGFHFLDHPSWPHHHSPQSRSLSPPAQRSSPNRWKSWFLLEQNQTPFFPTCFRFISFNPFLLLTSTDCINFMSAAS